ncbi:G-protein alpha subunit-domain-containing protein [Xylaria arbuscula]|nr:G-protein alpha subunit-domain-containing protein [Xylaria arbuscula]
MDPATVFQIVGTVVSLGDVVIKCIARLSTLKAQFHDAPIIVTSMIGQLHMVKIAQDQLSTASTNDPRYYQLAAHIGNALDSFSLILLTLSQQLDRYEGIRAEQMPTKTRLGFLNGEREMTNLSILLDRQVNALNLLLQAIQCTTWTQLSEVMTREESQSIIRLAQDCSSSLLGLDDVASFISESTAAISAQFEFDDVLRSTLLYKTAERSHLRQAIRARRVKNIERIPTDNVSLRSATSGLRRAFRTMKFSSLMEESDSLENQQGLKVNIQDETVLETQITPNRNKPSLGNWRKPFQRREFKPQQQTKVLLLGISETGKTTLLNALRLFVGNGRIENDLMHTPDLIWDNAFNAVKVLLEDMEWWGEWGNSPWGQIYRKFERQPILWQRRYASAIVELSRNDDFQLALKSGTAHEFHDNSEYLIRNVERLAEQSINGSVPTHEDVLRTRVRTTGIHKTELKYNGAKYLLHDVGGERSERKKWIHAFEHTAIIVFLVDTTGYGRALYEDREGDRMLEQFSLWESLVNSSKFTDTKFLIVFTKMDLLDEHLRKEAVRDFLSTRGVPATIEHYLQFLEVRFMELIRWPEFREERIRFVRTNLVDVETRSAAVDVINALKMLNEPRTSKPGNYDATVKQSGSRYPFTVNDENRELPHNNAHISQNQVDDSAETSSSDDWGVSDRYSDMLIDG